MKALAWYAIVMCVIGIGFAILYIGVPLVPLATWVAILAILLMVPIIILAILVIRQPK